MRYTTLLVLALFFVLAGCAAHDAKINPMLNSMSSVNQAINVFGPPIQVSDLHDGAKVYVWNTNRNAQIGGIPVYQPNSQTHTGSVYSPSGGYAGTYSGQSYGSGTVTYTPVQNLNFSCTLKMIVEQDGGIRTWSYQGNVCDSLIVNSSLPQLPKSEGAGLNGCLEQEANKYIGKESDLEAISAKIEQVCLQKTGGRIPNLAMYYVRQAQDGKQGLE